MDVRSPAVGSQSVHQNRTSPPLTVAALRFAEQLVLWSFRKLLENAANRFVVQQELWCACGPVNVESAVDGVELMFETLDRCARRELRLAPLACCRVAADERAILALVAACQQRRKSEAAALSVWLVTAGYADHLREAATMLAAALADSGHFMPRRGAPAPRRTETGTGVSPIPSPLRLVEAY